MLWNGIYPIPKIFANFFIMKNPNNFQDVTDRLIRGIGVPSETELAAKLGMSQTAWAKRKMRNALPSTEIDTLIEQQGFNPDYIYEGMGGLFAGEGWEAEYKARASALRLAKLPLLEVGHAEKTIDALINLSKKDAHKANAHTFLTALRDAFRFIEVDLTQLITGVDLSKDTDQPTTMDKSERLLVEAYRNASKKGKDFIQNAASMAAK
jgi:hypothetical protein